MGMKPHEAANQGFRNLGANAEIRKEIWETDPDTHPPHCGRSPESAEPPPSSWVADAAARQSGGFPSWLTCATLFSFLPSQLYLERWLYLYILFVENRAFSHLELITPQWESWKRDWPDKFAPGIRRSRNRPGNPYPPCPGRPYRRRRR
jgi:hypothetical protein